MVLRPIIAAVCTAVVASSAAGQSVDSRVSVRGLVYDSLRGAPLRSALITVIEQGRRASSDARGLFAFDGLAPGTYTFGVQHAALDSIGFTGLAVRAAVGAGHDALRIAVPSFATLWRAACGDSRPPTDSGFIYGTVRDALSGAPVPNATIELTWIDLSIGRKFRVSQTRCVRGWELLRERVEIGRAPAPAEDRQRA